MMFIRVLTVETDIKDFLLNAPCIIWGNAFTEGLIQCVGIHHYCLPQEQSVHIYTVRGRYGQVENTASHHVTYIVLELFIDGAIFGLVSHCDIYETCNTVRNEVVKIRQCPIFLLMCSFNKIN